MVLRTLYLQWLLLLYLQNYETDSISKNITWILSIKWVSLSLYSKNFNKNSNSKGKIALLVSTKKLISCPLNSHT